MTLITYPLDDTTYSADDAALFHATRSTGIHAGDDFTFSVNGADNMVTLGPGIAWMRLSRFKGVVTAMKTETVIDMGLTDQVYPRIDHLVLQYDANNNAVSTVVKSGVAASNPLPPARSMTEALYEIHLLQVRRNPGAVSISAADVTDLRLDAAWCGLMAESVTNIDTDSINRHVQQILSEVKTETAILLEAIQNELANVESGSAFEFKKLNFFDTVVATSAFAADSTYPDDFPYRAAVPLAGAIESMIPYVTFSAADAISGIFAPVAETYNGGIYLYAADIPESAITIPTILLWKENAQ